MGFQNYYASKITNAIGAGDTTIVVDTAPSVTSGRMALEARNSTQREIIKYTNVSGNTLTGVTRGQGGTTAKAHVAGSLIEMNATAEDLQDLYDAFNSFAGNNTNWVASPYTFSSVTALGNRSYQCVVNGQNLTNIWSAGMRLRTTRTVAAGVNCTSLNGTTQYFSKTSPAGMTYTDDFVVSAWVKLSSYPASQGTIASRANGTNGWSFSIQSSGVVRLAGYNTGTGNQRNIQSYQSMPLNKWVHITAQLDMSTGTATTTTSYVMLDGVDVPAVAGTFGTNPTFLIQAGNLEIGTENAGSFFPGKIAQVAIYNAKVTQATILASMNQTLAGTETSLISAYSFNNTINDLNTTNANNLTANGSAVATNADSPFGCQANGTISSTLDYAIIQAVTFSTNTTVTVQVPEGCTIPTSGVVSSVVYSSNKAPYGMPVQRGKWRIVMLDRTSEAKATPGANTWYSTELGSPQLLIPVGEWMHGYEVTLYGLHSASSASAPYVTLSTTIASATDADMTSRSYASATGASAVATAATLKREKEFTATSATPVYLAVQSDIASMAQIQLLGVLATTKIYAENAYL